MYKKVNYNLVKLWIIWLKNQENKIIIKIDQIVIAIKLIAIKNQLV
jgi:hypothetical protein